MSKLAVERVDFYVPTDRTAEFDRLTDIFDARHKHGVVTAMLKKARRDPAARRFLTTATLGRNVKMPEGELLVLAKLRDRVLTLIALDAELGAVLSAYEGVLLP